MATVDWPADMLDPFMGYGVGSSLAAQDLDVPAGFTLFPEDFDTSFPHGKMWPANSTGEG